MLHFTVCTTPTSELNLEGDSRVLKATLLYADKVKLCSLMSSMLLSVMAIRELNPQQQIDFLEMMIPVVAKDPQSAAKADTSGHRGRWSSDQSGGHEIGTESEEADSCR